MLVKQQLQNELFGGSLPSRLSACGAALELDLEVGVLVFGVLIVTGRESAKLQKHPVGSRISFTFSPPVRVEPFTPLLF